MKTLFLFILLSLPALAEVTYDDCQGDADLFGNNKSSVIPYPECADLVKSSPAAASTNSADNTVRAFGNGKMVYVDFYDANSVFIERTLLSGQQSELVAVKKIFIEKTRNRLLVIQEKNGLAELLIFQLDFLGNVSPLKVMRSPVFGGALALKYVSSEVLELTTASGKYSVEADGESREELSTKRALRITAQ